MKIIDAWAQPALGRVRQKLPEVARLFEKSGSAHLLDQSLDPAQTVALMDAAGVERLMLCAWCRPEGWLWTNDDVAEFIRAFPDRFTGVATVHLADPVAAVRELDRAVRVLGFKALRVVPWLWKLPPNDKLYYPLYVKCIELDIPFCTQVGHTGPLMPSETGRPVPYLDEVALTFPELRIVGGHIGHPWTDEMIGLAWKHDNVFIDTSAYLPRYYPPALIHFMKTYGQQKVLFGSNFPQLSLEKCVEQVRQLDLGTEVETSFLETNARRVFRL
ncbi:amidohydrolase family protein [Stenotrophobium rhamnosiphilum]|uniref:Amidohydrolase n=1 Tax=Stenotrophobium rhamnosiphilum TaxID=2029166 RepID=A0A2T5MCC2_9GAMM|nr:amidohydrolase family protein [Stenotrophobium rhamnosiphilum]PTU30211.1 amidohydrolase [Stenotrophobium rhamnosiphilum]